MKGPKVSRIKNVPMLKNDLEVIKKQSISCKSSRVGEFKLLNKNFVTVKKQLKSISNEYV
jgi:hypothetical protein